MGINRNLDVSKVNKMHEKILKQLLMGQEISSVEKMLARLPEFSEPDKIIVASRIQFIDRIQGAFVFSLSLVYRSPDSESAGWRESYLVCCYLREHHIREVKALDLSQVVALEPVHAVPV